MHKRWLNQTDQVQKFAILWSFVRPHRGKLALALVLSLLTTGVGLATPMVTKWVLDTLEQGISLATPVAALLVLLVLSTATGYVQWVLLGSMAERIVYDAQTSLIHRFFRAKLGGLSRFKSGELVTRVTSDTGLLRAATSTSLVNVVNGSVALIGTLVLMAYLDVPLLLTTVGILAVLGAISAVLMPQIAQADEEAQDAVGDLGGSLESGFKALRTVKASLAEEREIIRAANQAEQAMVHQIRSLKISAVVWSIVGAGMQLAIIIILAVGAWRIAEGQMAVSALVAFLLYVFNVMGPVTELTEAFTSLQSGFAAAGRIQQTQDLPQEHLDYKAAATKGVVSESGFLELRGVEAAYDDARKAALRGIDACFPQTGHVALVGPSGAGKTSVFAVLLRFLEPTNGQVSLEGRDIAELSLRELRSQIGYVEQETPVLPGTIADNVRYRVPEASHDQVLAALRAVHLDEVVAELPNGVDTQVTANSLSGGQRQHLAIARALVDPPRILLLDEATAQLDGVTEAAVLAAIEKIAETSLVITIAHRLSTVVDADNILVLDSGKVQAQGTHQQLMATNELYREFVSALKISIETM